MAKQSTFLQPTSAGVFSDALINAQQTRARELSEKVSQIPRRAELQTPPIGDRFLNALLGASQGLQAAQPFINSPLPIASGIVAGAAGLQAPELFRQQQAAREAEITKAQAAATEQVFQNAMLDDVAPEIANKYGFAGRGITLAQFKLIEPIIARNEASDRRFELTLLRDKLRDENDILPDSTIAALFNNPVYRKFFDQNGYTQEMFIGKRPAQIKQLLPDFNFDSATGDVLAVQKGSKQLSGLAQPRKIANSIRVSENYFKTLRNEWEGIKDYVGVVEGEILARLGRLGLGPQEAEQEKENILARIAAYDSLVNASATTIRGLFNDSGAPSNFDVERLLSSLPSAGTPQAVARAQFEQFGSIISGGKQALNDTYPNIRLFDATRPTTDTNVPLPPSGAKKVTSLKDLKKKKGLQ